MPPVRRIDIVSISLLQITWPAVVMKLILLAKVLLNKRQLLYRCQDTHEFKNHIDVLVLYKVFFTIKAVPVGPGENRS